MTTKKDVCKDTRCKKAGGKDDCCCDLVSLGFWVCTDKNGKKWWCGATGECIEEPFKVRFPPRPKLFTLDLYLVQDKDGEYILTTPVAEAGIETARSESDD